MEAAGHIEPSYTRPVVEKKTVSIPIPIPKSNSYNNINLLEEYSLNCNNFDPGKMSPPDDWMGRLHQRIQHYYTSGSSEKNK